MTSPKITETDTVQFPMVRHAAAVSWTPLSPRDAIAMRGGAAGLLFRGVLEEALRRFNPGMTENAIRSVADNLLMLPPTIEGNRTDTKCRDLLEYLRWPDGIACLRCGSFEVVEVEQRHQIDCRSCGYRFSVTTGTIMHDFHLPLRRMVKTDHLTYETLTA